jgi:Raf kinase inhibitor-like YbhB/YbcL family protein
MKKPDYSKSPDLQKPVNHDSPIIHSEDPENAEGITFTDLPEKMPGTDWSETDDVTTAVYFKELKITSPAFKNNDRIPVNYTCDGINVNPPLEIEHIPAEAKCLALIVDDPDASVVFVHWLAWNIPVTHHIRENDIHGLQGVNDFHKNKYQGPCPPSETHHYFFKVYALDALLHLNANTRKRELEKAMSNHIIGFGQLIGTYKRPD